MRFVFHLVLAMVIAIVVSFNLSKFALDNGNLLGAVQAGPWTARPSAGTAQADPYTRADMARTGALPLGRSEGMRFTARADGDGLPLAGKCAYTLSGTTPIAALWTLYAVDGDKKIVSAAAGAASINSHQISRYRDGRFKIAVAPDLQPGNWLQIETEEPFQLILNLYDTNIFLGGGSEIGEMPVIERGDCE